MPIAAGGSSGGNETLPPQLLEWQLLARRDDLSVYGRASEISCVDVSGRTRWTHGCGGRPNAAHIAGGRVLVTTDSLEYTAWGFLGPALLLSLADGTLIAELRGERGAALHDGRFLLGLEGIVAIKGAGRFVGGAEPADVLRDLLRGPRRVRQGVRWGPLRESEVR